MVRVDRNNGQNYADNIIDSLLDFEQTQTWTTSTGTGTATINNAFAYAGDSCLKIENTNPTNDIEVTNSVQSSVINVSGDYQFSMFARKDDSGVPYSGHIEVFKNAVTYSTQTFTLGSDDSNEDYPDFNEQWVRFISDTTLTFAKSDVVTIKIQLDGIVGYADPSTIIYIDGLMLNQNQRGNIMPPLYNRPVYNSTLQTSEVSIENLDLTNLGEYADDAAAGVGGLTTDQVYKTVTGELRIKL